MTELPKIERFDTWIEYDGNPRVARDYRNNGEFIEVSDLVYWIKIHLREGAISNIYSDLLKALNEGGK